MSEVIEKAIATLTKRFGEGAILLSSDVGQKDVQVFPSGSVALDMALGVGGIPRGRVTEVYGGESAGKTTLCLSVIAEAQKQGVTCAFIDVEHAMDLIYAQRCGVNLDFLYIVQPDCGEQALETLETLVRTGAFGVIVVDSVAALVPKKEIEGTMGDAQMGAQARLMSQAMRKLTPIIQVSNTAVIFINQLRMKIGVVFGNPETTAGGNALKYYSSVRLDIRRKQSNKNTGEIRSRVKVTKNKVAPPFREAEFDIGNSGVSKSGDTLDVAASLNIVTKRGAYYAFEDSKLGQGRDNAKLFLDENPEVMAAIVSRIRNSGDHRLAWGVTEETQAAPDNTEFTNTEE